jgi:D-alanyl-D-alanine carboxypeptidase
VIPLLTRSPTIPRTRSIAILAAGSLLLSACASGPPTGARPDGLPVSSGTATVTTIRDQGYGALGAPISPFDDVPAITHLSDDLREALREAATEAANEDIPLFVTSGWRGTDYQQELFDDAVDTYGSEEEALKWVLPPDLTSHTTGDAVDVGHTDGAYWLGRFGNRWGLCQPFANEVWHFELLTTPGGTCPQQLGTSAERLRSGVFPK